MKIIVTGSRGMLGTDLMQMLQVKASVLGCDLHNCDILNETHVDQMVASYRPDVIIHAAAYTNVDQAEADHEAAMQVNVTGTKHVAAVAQRYHAKLVYISTDYVFDGTKPSPYTEEDHPHPLGVYGESKIQGERQVHQMGTLSEHHSGHHQNYLIVRTAWLYGKHGKNFVTAILQRAQQQETLHVVNDQFGSPTYTKDLVRGVLALLDQGATGIVHVTNDGYCTWYEFAKTILELAGVSHVSVEPITTAALNRPAPRPAFSVLDLTKFRNLTKQHMPHWKDGLKRYLEEMRET